MRVAILGSRRFPRPGEILHRVDALPKGSVVVHGNDTAGVDLFVDWACNNLKVEHEVVCYKWDPIGESTQTHDKNCGLLDQDVKLVIIYHEDKSNVWISLCVREAKKRGIQVEEHYDA